jgi:hypothetical protein
MAERAQVPGEGQSMSREAFRAWVMEQPKGRYERIDGIVVRMASEMRSHARIKFRVARLLEDAVLAAGLPCEVYPDGVTVQSGDSDFEPDALMRCGPPLVGDGIDVPDPMIIVEVLSRSTGGIDNGKKLIAYFGIPTVRHYLIFQPDRPQVIHHRRMDDGDGILTRILPGGEIPLDPPGIALSIEAVYAP